MKIGYARVSTREQNLDLQITALYRAGMTIPAIMQQLGIRSRSTVYISAAGESQAENEIIKYQ